MKTGFKGYAVLPGGHDQKLQQSSYVRMRRMRFCMYVRLALK